ncbi:MAG TPA: HU family DNA-binding protein [Longimicrobium sp.]
MNRRELVRALAYRAELTVAQAADAVDAIFGIRDGIIPEKLRAGETVLITGFGRFERRQRPGRTGRDPRTGKEIDIAAATSASFKPASALRAAILEEKTAAPVEEAAEAEEEMPGGPVLRGGRGPRATSSTGPRKSGDGAPTLRGGTRGPAGRG